MTHRTDEEPGRENALPPIPVGVEHLLCLAAAHPGFADALETQRDRLADAGDVPLSASERAMLRAAAPGVIARLTASVTVPDPARRGFLEQATLALAALAGGAALAGCERRPDGASGSPPAPAPDAAPRPAPDAAAARTPDATAPAPAAPDAAAPGSPDAALPDAGRPPPRPRPMQHHATRGATAIIDDLDLDGPGDPRIIRGSGTGPGITGSRPDRAEERRPR